MAGCCPSDLKLLSQKADLVGACLQSGTHLAEAL